MHIDSRLEEIERLIRIEFLRATKQYGPMKSLHDGYAILLEEVDELWDAIKLKPEHFSKLPAIREEAVQVAAMAMRSLYDCCGEMPL